MRYDWDPEKAVSNLAKHGVAFETALRLDWTRDVSSEQRVGRERRVKALVPLESRIHVCVYTQRGAVRRVISLRKANRREVATYIARMGAQ